MKGTFIFGDRRSLHRRGFHRMRKSLTSDETMCNIHSMQTLPFWQCNIGKRCGEKLLCALIHTAPFFSLPTLFKCISFGLVVFLFPFYFFFHFFLSNVHASVVRGRLFSVLFFSVSLFFFNSFTSQISHLTIIAIVTEGRDFHTELLFKIKKKKGSTLLGAFTRFNLATKLVFSSLTYKERKARKAIEANLWLFFFALLCELSRFDVFPLTFFP